MQIQQYSGEEERRILIGMIVDRVVIARIAGRWPKENEDGLFGSKWANLVGYWCVRYFNKYDAAPGGKIESIFSSWASARERDRDTVSLVERFLSGLSQQYEREAHDSNPQYILDLADGHFNTVRMERLTELVKGHIASGKPAEAQKVLDSWGRIEMAAGSGVDVFQDEEAVRAAFEEESESLIEWPDGAFAAFYGNTIRRSAFVALLAPEKRGKTWHLMSLAMRAMLARRRVAFFSVGDIDEQEFIRERLGVWSARRPLAACRVKIPRAIIRNDEDKFATPEFEEREYLDRLTWGAAVEANKKVMDKLVKSDQSYFRLSTHPNSSINVQGVTNIIQGWQRDGWSPDVVVIDYADILAPPYGVADTRDQINLTWKQLRGLSQKLHACVITATQADAMSYNQELLGMHNFSEDKRKLAHCTAMMGLNQTDIEKEQQIFRYNWIVRRSGKYSPRWCIHVAGCLDIGRPDMKACF